MAADLKSSIRKWIKDYEATQPSNVCMDEDSFYGSAYYLLNGVLKDRRNMDRKINKLKRTMQIMADYVQDELDAHGDSDLLNLALKAYKGRG